MITGKRLVEGLKSTVAERKKTDAAEMRKRRGGAKQPKMSEKERQLAALRKSDAEPKESAFNEKMKLVDRLKSLTRLDKSANGEIDRIESEGVTKQLRFNCARD